jgi:DNA modification methylase
MIRPKSNKIFNDLDKIERVPLSSVKPPSKMLRVYTKAHIRTASRCVERFGFLCPLLLDADGVILAGMIWFLAAQALELPEIPIMRVDHLSAEERLAYQIAEQRLVELSTWDDKNLGEALKELSEYELDFDLDITGFSTTEIDLRIESVLDLGNDQDADGFPPDRPAKPVTQVNDLWLAGSHRLLCGSALDKQCWLDLMDGKLANLVFTDPPYNVRIVGHVGGKGKIKHPEFAMASGEMSSRQYRHFLSDIGRALQQNSAEGSLHYFCIDWRHVADLIGAGSDVYRTLINICVWVKANGGMGSFYRSRHELVLVFRNGSKPHRNNIELGRHGRNRTNVWEYSGGNSFSGRLTDEGNLLQLHPTVKPVQMIVDAILDSTARNEIVVDCFLGSGSTLLAAERVGRRLYGLEIDPAYIDVCIKRWQRHTGQQAILASSGRTFSDVALDREAA